MAVDFGSTFLTDHLITYIGNKRKLLKFINAAVDEIKAELGRDNMTMLDGFSGSGVVARLFKQYASELYVNDLEGYSTTINRCYLSNVHNVSLEVIKELIDFMNAHKLDPNKQGFIERHYAPIIDDNIQLGERVFYTNRNAKIIDNIRRYCDLIGTDLMHFVLAPLLVKASIHNNTSGVFKGFHKKDGIGAFGGAGANALTRIKGEITLEYPVFSEHECPVHIIQKDINEVVKELPELDVVYYDPPYNQHPYGSNYFMLNVINDYDDPEIQDGVSGIAKNWNRSNYNKRQEAELSLNHLVENTKSKFILISYNDEGIIPVEAFRSTLEGHGTVTMKEKPYNTYRGSKNLGKNKVLKDGQVRPLQVRELLWILRK